MELIDKSALVAEIEKVIEEPAPPYDSQCRWEDGYYCGLYKAESIIDTLEVKEVDLENLFQALPEKIADEKSHQLYELSIYHYDGQCVVDYVGEIDHDSLYTFDGNTLYEAIEKVWNWLHKNSTGG